MYIMSECDSVCVEYNKMVKARSKRTSTIWSYIFLGFLVIMIILPLIPDLLDKGEGWVLYIIYGSMGFVGLSIALLVSMFTISHVPAFKYLFREVYGKINQEKGTYYNYDSFEKEKFDFNINGGLFSKSCRTEVRRHISGTTPNSNTFDIFDVTLVTGGGKNKAVHFKGIYFVAKMSSPIAYQIGSNSKPRSKEIKYVRIEEFKELRVFIEENKTVSNAVHKYIQTLDRLKRNLNAKKIYLSVTKDEIHFAYVPKVPIGKQYNLNIKKLNELYSTFLYEPQVIDELIDTSAF